MEHPECLDPSPRYASVCSQSEALFASWNSWKIVSLVQRGDHFQRPAGHLGCVTTQHPVECVVLHPLPVRREYSPLISTHHDPSFHLTLEERGFRKMLLVFIWESGGRGLSEITQDVQSEVRSWIWVSLVCFCLGYSRECRHEHTDGPGFLMPHQYLSPSCKLQDKVNWRSSALKNQRKLQNAFPIILLFSLNDV